eukprot:m.232293 g.232293  ORF g.232293 m.232293 type:complete len:232 (+) comp40078_c0_seq17:3055-3750(+)
MSTRTQSVSFSESTDGSAATPMSSTANKSPKLGRNGSVANGGHRRPRPATLNLDSHNQSSPQLRTMPSPRTPNSRPRNYDRQLSAPSGAVRGPPTPDSARSIGASRSTAHTPATPTTPQTALKMGSLPRSSRHRGRGEGESDQTSTPTLPRAKSYDRGLVASPEFRNGSEPGVSGKSVSNDIPMRDLGKHHRLLRVILELDNCRSGIDLLVVVCLDREGFLQLLGSLLRER